MDLFTVKIQQNPELGRYFVAARDLKAGEVLFEETPFAIGPKTSSPPLCLNCYCPVDGSAGGPRCSACSWPLCAECNTTASKRWHSGECEVFVKAKCKFQSVDDSTTGCPQLDCITPLRVLLEKEKNPQRWDSEIAPMEDHEQNRNGTEYWQADAINIVQYIRNGLGLKERFDEDLIQKVIGILEINGFEARTIAGYNLRCLYPKLAIFAHSCCPTVTHSVWPSEEFKMVARPTVNVKANEALHTCYTYTLYGTATRQQNLKYGKFFTCRCARCLDPTELGTHFSSFKCNKCDPGLILSSDPLNLDAPWKCNNCEFGTSGAAIQKAVGVMQQELDAVPYNDYETPAGILENYERLYRKFRSVLHPRHFIQTSIRHSLIELYGRIEGYEMQELPDILLERKAEMCRDLLKVVDVFEAGMSRSRAMILYELHAPLVLMARTAFTAGVLTGEPLKKRLEEAIELLAECSKILQWEDPTTPEGILAQVSQQSLKQLQDSLDSV